jgi:hypothetical protein
VLLMTVQALSNIAPPRSPAVSVVSRVIVAQVGDDYRLDDASLATAATSCLLRPLAGDRVLVSDCGDQVFILHVLSRAAGQAADLGVAGAERLRIGHARLDLYASEAMALRSLKDLELQAVTGSLGLSARNLLITAIDSLLERVRHRISRAEEICMRARGLLKLHGQNGFITAERDVRIDGERINVG